MSDESKELTLRVHDECKMSLFFPAASYLTDASRQWFRRVRLGYLYVQALPDVRYRGMYQGCSEGCVLHSIIKIRSAIDKKHIGGVGVVVYFRKEGRALGEVTKYV